MVEPRGKAWLPYPIERFLEQVAAQNIMRLTAHEAQGLIDTYGGLTNLEKAKQIISEIGELKAVQNYLKAAFKNDELDGGWKAALTHPLFVDATVRIDELEQQLKELI